MDNTAILIDANSLIHRAYHALPKDMRSSEGQITNAVYGFISMIIKIIGEFKPAYLAAAYDMGPPERRLKIYGNYKAHRKKTPDELIEQISLTREFLNRAGISFFEKKGFEADDILASMARRIVEQNEKVKVKVLTGDKDAFQIIDERITVISTVKGISEIAENDKAAVVEKYGIEPGQVADFIALKGDSSDNIPGVPGIGDKTAAALLKENDNLESLFSNLDSVENRRVRALLEENRENALLYKKIAELEFDVEIDFELEGIMLKKWSDSAIIEFLNSLEIRALDQRIKKLSEEIFETDAESVKAIKIPKSYKTIRTISDFRKAIAKQRGDVFLSAFYETHKDRVLLRGLSVLETQDGILILELNENDFADAVIVTCGKSLSIITHHLKELCRLLIQNGLDGNIDANDVMMLHYLINPERTEHDIETQAEELGYGVIKEADTERQPCLGLDECSIEENLGLSAALRTIWKTNSEKYNDPELQKLYRNIEMPVCKVIAGMEHKGIGVDRSKLEEFRHNIDMEIEKNEKGIREYSGTQINLNSPKQISQLLYEDLGIERPKRKSSAYSTDASTLSALTDKHPVVALILTHRELSKIKGTYIEPLIKMISHKTGRVHTTFNQTVAATGRLSCSNPNLQSIPARSIGGVNIREVFVPGGQEQSIVVADYSQIELRVLAHLSQDRALREVFFNDEDVHARTAMEIFSISQDQVGSEERRKAKVVNFGIIYGMTPASLAAQLKIEKDEAKEYINRYFEEFSGVKRYLDETVQKALRSGFVKTISGRIRNIPQLKSDDIRTRFFGERIAFNSPIQGSAADIIKIAMINVYERIREIEGASLLLQIHDELILECDNDYIEDIIEVVKKEMENAVELSIPLKANIGFGDNWFAAKT